MVTAAELRELEAEKLRADVAMAKAQASKFRAQGTYTRRKDAMLKQEQDDLNATAYEQRILEFTREVTEESVAEAISSLGEWRVKSKADITIRITSPGGDTVWGLALYDYVLALRAERIKVVTVALGWAASMSGILLQAGTKRYVAPNMHMLIHNIAATGLPDYIKLPDLEDDMKFMKSLEERGDNILAERSTLSVEEIRKRMARKNWWINAEDAVRLGFADDFWPPKKGRRK